METITGEEFEKRLYANENDILEDLEVNFIQSSAIDLNKVNARMTLKKITFTGNSLRFYSSNTSISTIELKLIDNIYNIDVSFENCDILNLSLENETIEGHKFVIEYCKINDLNLNNINTLNSSFLIKGCNIDYCHIENSTFKETKFKIEQSTYKDYFLISQCEFKYLSFNYVKVKDKFDFFSNELSETTGSEGFYNCEFNRVSFYETIFNPTTDFFYCTFSGVSNFEGIGNIKTTHLKFLDCTFEKYVTFNHCKLNKISFDQSKFNEVASFQNSNFNFIDIDRTVFEKMALFDDIHISKLDNCNRRTIRNIKQQLQKAENKIDYNRFRTYELSIYYKELNWRKNFRDKFILSATKLSTGFEHSWTKAFWFTIISGLFWYSILYFWEYHGVFKFKEINNFFTGAFRFFLITDFNNPLKDDKTYLDNGLQWVILTIGKIFIAFGIYEMIQAFRKFKA